MGYSFRIGAMLLFFKVFLRHPTDRITPAVELWGETEGNFYLTFFWVPHIYFLNIM